jgi:hypothetical protein
VEFSFRNRLGAERELNSQNGNSSEINPEKWRVFRARKMTINLPAFTSNPPQIHHQKTTFCTPFLRKPPAKTLVIQAKKITAKTMGFPTVF